MSIINLPGWNVTGSKANKDDYRLSATYDDDAETPACPKCTTLFTKVYGHGSRKQFIMDLPAPTAASPGRLAVGPVSRRGGGAGNGRALSAVGGDVHKTRM